MEISKHCKSELFLPPSTLVAKELGHPFSFSESTIREEGVDLTNPAFSKFS